MLSRCGAATAAGPAARCRPGADDLTSPCEVPAHLATPKITVVCTTACLFSPDEKTTHSRRCARREIQSPITHHETPKGARGPRSLTRRG